MDNIKYLEREVALLKELLELKTKLLEFERYQPYNPYVPYVPYVQYYPQPLTYPWVQYTDTTVYCGSGASNGTFTGVDSTYANPDILKITTC